MRKHHRRRLLGVQRGRHLHERRVFRRNLQRHLVPQRLLQRHHLRPLRLGDGGPVRHRRACVRRLPWGRYLQLRCLHWRHVHRRGHGLHGQRMLQRLLQGQRLRLQHGGHVQVPMHEQRRLLRQHRHHHLPKRGRWRDVLQVGYFGAFMTVPPALLVQ